MKGIREDLKSNAMSIHYPQQLIQEWYLYLQPPALFLFWRVRGQEQILIRVGPVLGLVACSGGEVEREVWFSCCGGSGC